MATSSTTTFEPNAIRWLLARNAFHHVLSSIDPNLPIETQIELVENVPDGRLYDVCPLESMSEFQSHFLLKQYESAIREKLFAGFSSYEEKMAHALSAQAISSLPDAMTIDYDTQYHMIKREYKTKIIEYFFEKSSVNLTITPQSTAINAILLRNTINQYKVQANDTSRIVGNILYASEILLPNLIELRKSGLSLPLYLSFFDEIGALYMTHSIHCVMKPNTPGLSDSFTRTKIREAYETLKSAPDLPENYLSLIPMSMDSSDKAIKRNSNSGCLGILILLFILIPTLGFAASKLFF